MNTQYMYFLHSCIRVLLQSDNDESFEDAIDDVSTKPVTERQTSTTNVAQSMTSATASEAIVTKTTTNTTPSTGGASVPASGSKVQLQVLYYRHNYVAGNGLLHSVIRPPYNYVVFFFEGKCRENCFYFLYPEASLFVGIVPYNCSF